MISPATYLFKFIIKFTCWFRFVVNLWKEGWSSANILHNEFIPSGRSFMYIKNKSRVLILVELQTFFSTQMFDHLRQLFVLDFQDSFWVAKEVHLQHHKLLIFKWFHHVKLYQRLLIYLKRLLSHQQWDFHLKMRNVNYC